MHKKILTLFFIMAMAANVANGHNSNHLITSDYASSPVYFSKNEGQVNNKVLFTGIGSNCQFFFSHQGTTFSLKTNANESFALKLNFINAKQHPAMIGEEELSGKSNYFIGNDPSRWKTNIKTYKKIRIEELYQGIDLIYYGNQTRLEYDFVVKPGVSPDKIKLSYDLGESTGDNLSIDNNGNLVITTPAGEIIEHKPICYQLINGKRVEIEGNYKIINKNKNVFSFEIADYDKNYTLFIDPIIEYITYFGGSERDWCFGATKDKQGNIYFSGNTNSVNYPVKAGAYSNSSGGNIDCVITKLNPTCTQVIYSTYIGGSGADYGGGVSVDGEGNAYITANTNSYNFPTTENAMFRSRIGPNNIPHPDIAIVKLSSKGDALLYSTFFGGSGIDAGGTIYADAPGNMYISLFTESNDLPVSDGAFSAKHNGKKDGYLMKLDAEGKRIYSSYFGGKDDEFITSIAADKNGNLIIAGTTRSTDLAKTSSFGNIQPENTNLFIAKINANGTKVLFNNTLGGKGNEGVSTLKLDNEGNIYIGGFTESKDFPLSKKPIQKELLGTRDGFVSKISADGTNLVYSTLIGGNGYDKVTSIAILENGNLYFAGSTSSSDFPVTKNAFDETYNGGSIENGYGGDVFLCELDEKKSKLNYSSFFGGIDNDENPNLVLISEDEVMLIGQTESNDLPVSKNAVSKTNKGKTEVFITKFNMSNDLTKNNAPVANNSITDLSAEYNKLFKIKVPVDLFTDKDNYEVLPLEFSLSTGEPLPAWMKYDAQSGIFMGLPPKEGEWSINISTIDNHSAKANSQFKLKVIDSRKEKKPIDLDYACVAYYPLDGTANDAGSNNYNGIVKRARLCEDKNGNQNSAYFFNGSDNYIRIDNIKEFKEIDVITVCAWINPASYENWISWVSKPLNEDRSQFRASFGGNPGKSWGLTQFNETWYAYEAEESNIPLNEWSFVVITANQITGEVKTYLNGKLVGTDKNLKNFIASEMPWYIGYQADDKFYFDGKIDEVRLYNRILSDEEIMALYQL